MRLFDFQREALERVDGRDHCAFYHDMGLGKTFTGAAKMDSLGHDLNLVVCQASKLADWCDHFRENYPGWDVVPLRGTPKASDEAIDRLLSGSGRRVGVVNYETLTRRPRLVEAPFGCVMFDESSLLQRRTSKRTKAAMRLADKARSVVLLSGTPTDGRYERLWTQMRMLGWSVSERAFWSNYVDYYVDRRQGFPIVIVKGYKNVERLKGKLRELGCDFLKTEDVVDLPEQTFVRVGVPMTKECRRFQRDRVVEAFGRTFVGDSTFGALTCERLLAGVYSKPKLVALSEVLEGTSERVVVFYNFDIERFRILNEVTTLGRPWSLVCGGINDLENFREKDDTVLLVQYQAGAMGLNLQEARYVVYFSPPLASSLYEQSKKRVHRVGQTRPCTYYNLVSDGTVEEDIYANLALRRDYTERLFERRIRGE